MPHLAPPFERWPVQHFDPRYGYAWYCGGGVVVSHITIPCGTAAAAHAYHDYEGSVLALHGEEITRAGGLFVIHDWRAMTTYEAQSRQAWQERMRSRPKGYLKGSIVCVTRATPLLRMAVQAANLVASVVHGAKVELGSDVESVLRAHRVSPLAEAPPRSTRIPPG